MAVRGFKRIASSHGPIIILIESQRNINNGKFQRKALICSELLTNRPSVFIFKIDRFGILDEFHKCKKLMKNPDKYMPGRNWFKIHFNICLFTSSFGNIKTLR
jgi:hypothetical protein